MLTHKHYRESQRESSKRKIQKMGSSPKKTTLQRYLSQLQQHPLRTKVRAFSSLVHCDLNLINGEATDVVLGVVSFL